MWELLQRKGKNYSEKETRIAGKSQIMLKKKNYNKKDYTCSTDLKTHILSYFSQNDPVYARVKSIYGWNQRP